MAIFTWEESNLGFYRYDDFEDYIINEATAPDNDEAFPSDFTVTLDYFNNGEDFDPERYAYTIEFEITDVESVQWEDGPDAGTYFPVSGVIDTITYYDIDGDVILTVTEAGIYFPWAVTLDEDEFDRIYEYFEHQDNTYLGDANGDESTWDDYDDYDNINTGRGDDFVKALGGNDYITDGGGADDYRGGAGRDTLSYQDWYYDPFGIEGGIVVKLNKGTVVGPDGETDAVKGIEAVYGTFLDDSFTGDKEDNFFRGFQGDDTYNGKGGFDIVDYRRDDDFGGFDGVRIKLNKGTGTDGFG
ncbi:hypothetical protein N9O61_03750, partial [Octadecabacter sp.]|nr:hypothetical protein [Octadecabacter sp.]